MTDDLTGRALGKDRALKEASVKRLSGSHEIIEEKTGEPFTFSSNATLYITGCQAPIIRDGEPSWRRVEPTKAVWTEAEKRRRGELDSSEQED